MPHKNIEEKRAYQREYNQRPEVRKARQAYQKKWSADNADRKKAYERQRSKTRRARILVTNCKKRVRAKGLAFDLDEHVDGLQSRIDRVVCEITGYPFNLDGGRTFDSPSLDRIDSTKGYTIDNVRVVLHCINAAMGDWGEGHLADVIKCWLSQVGNAIVPQVAAEFIQAYKEIA